MNEVLFGGLRPRSNPLAFYMPFLTREAKKDTRHVRAGTSYADHACVREFPALSGEVTCIEPPHRESKGN